MKKTFSKIGLWSLQLLLGLCILTMFGMVFAKLLVLAQYNQIAFSMIMVPVLGSIMVGTIFGAHKIGKWILCR
jgi:hypothetical protein